MAKKSASEREELSKQTAWKTKWVGRLPENEEELREWREAFAEYLEARYDLPPLGEPATITRY